LIACFCPELGAVEDSVVLRWMMTSYLSP